MTSVQSTVSVLQDEASDGPFKFEGAEKLLELWFAEDAEAASTQGKGINGLRDVKRAVWEEMLDLVRCKVLSVIEGEEVDAYLLSESSMFVWPHKIILKTCGTTTLLLGLNRLLQIADTFCGFSSVQRCFYSRKAFMFPEKQIGPHKHWDEEVKFLDNEFGEGNGSAYVVGKMNGDHWLLYLTAPSEERGQPPALSSPGVSLVSDVLASSSLTEHGDANGRITPLPSTPSSTRAAAPPDQTLEILMTHLEPEACNEFFYPLDQLKALGSENENQQGHLNGAELSKRLGIDTLLPDSTLDSFLFTPCGYSANIVKGDRYATIHVTPEQDWSYASFECNIDFRTRDKSHHHSSMHDLIERVLRIFRPRTLSLTLFVSVDENEDGSTDQASTPETRTILDPKVAEGYRRTDRILYEFAGYHLLFSTFEKR